MDAAQEPGSCPPGAEAEPGGLPGPGPPAPRLSAAELDRELDSRSELVRPQPCGTAVPPRFLRPGPGPSPGPVPFPVPSRPRCPCPPLGQPRGPAARPSQGGGAAGGASLRNPSCSFFRAKNPNFPLLTSNFRQLVSNQESCAYTLCSRTGGSEGYALSCFFFS